MLWKKLLQTIPEKTVLKTDKYKDRINKSVVLDWNKGKSTLRLNWLITKYGVALSHRRSPALKDASDLVVGWEYYWVLWDRKT